MKTRRNAERPLAQSLSRSDTRDLRLARHAKAVHRRAVRAVELDALPILEAQ
jgi:hypothetical protein